jgi:hypothetical protein
VVARRESAGSRKLVLRRSTRWSRDPQYVRVPVGLGVMGLHIRQHGQVHGGQRTRQHVRVELASELELVSDEAAKQLRLAKPHDGVADVRPCTAN